MIVDFQMHYTPPELLKGDRNAVSVQLDEHGNPSYLLNPLLTDLPAHVRVMDQAGIAAGVLSCGSGFDQPDLGICRLINDRMKQAVDDHPGRFIGLGHVPALKPAQAAAEMKRCAVDLGFPGVVIGSELQGQALDADALRPFWRTAADLGLYVFIHPLPNVIRWQHMDADDLGRMVGWEFSLMVAALRLINSGVLDELPTLKFNFRISPGGSAAISAAFVAFNSVTSGVPPRSRAMAGNRQSRSIIISIIAFFTIVAAGPAPIMPPNGARIGCASGSKRSRFHRRCLRRTIRKRYGMPAKSPAMSRPCVRSAPTRAKWSRALQRRPSFPI